MGFGFLQMGEETLPELENSPMMRVAFAGGTSRASVPSLTPPVLDC
jgi:hypothetical protein